MMVESLKWLVGLINFNLPKYIIIFKYYINFFKEVKTVNIFKKLSATIMLLTFVVIYALSALAINTQNMLEKNPDVDEISTKDDSSISRPTNEKRDKSIAEPEKSEEESFTAGDVKEAEQKVKEQGTDDEKIESKPIERPIGDDWRVPAIIVASAGLAGLIGSSKVKKKADKKSYENLEESLDQIIPEGDGIWIFPDARDDVLEEINSVSAVKYKVDEDGFLIINEDAKVDNDKSFKASKLIDKVSHNGNKTIIGIDDKFYRPNIRTGEITQNSLDGGISIGDETTDSVVILNEDSLTGINVLHELGHVLEDFEDDVSAMELENEIRKDLGMEKREDDFEDKRLFYNNLNAGESFLEDLANSIGARVNEDDRSDGYFVISEDLITDGYFFVGDDYGTYRDPNTGKIVVRDKNFRYQMNMDLGEGEVYLRRFVEGTGRVIEWFEDEEMAVIKAQGERYDIYPNQGEYGTYINQNDRIVIEEEVAREFLGIDGFEDMFDENKGANNQLEVNEISEDEYEDMKKDDNNNEQDDYDVSDIEENEVYLRSYVEQLGGEITWDGVENKANVEINGRTESIGVGDYDSRIVNDRIVIQQDVIDELFFA